jgi:hypothetical protein
LEVARWLKGELENREIESNTGQVFMLRVFVDEDEPSHSNWRDKLIPTLEHSRAIIVLLDRAAVKRKEGNDYLHEELEWLVSNPKRTPILLQLDTVSRNALIAQPKFSKWEHVHALPCFWDAWKNESRDEQTANLKRLIGQICESIRNLGSLITLKKSKTYVGLSKVKQTRENPRQEQERRRRAEHSLRPFF